MPSKIEGVMSAILALPKVLPLALLLGFVATVTVAQNQAETKAEPCAPAHAADSQQLAENCRHFIRGFLHGALLTDAAIVARLSDRADQSAFTRRALETRGRNRIEDLPATYYASFCLPGDGVTDQVITRLQQQLNGSGNHTEQAEERLYQALKQSFPCNQVNG